MLMWEQNSQHHVVRYRYVELLFFLFHPVSVAKQMGMVRAAVRVLNHCLSDRAVSQMETTGRDHQAVVWARLQGSAVYPLGFSLK